MSQMQSIYADLRQRILGLDLAPGDRLSERWLETQFAGSRTPIRAALVRLEADGLVLREGRGYCVAPIDLREMDQIYVYRETIETGAVKLTCARVVDAELDVLLEMLNSCGDDTSQEEWHRVGNEFHVELARLSANDFFLRAIQDVMTRLSRARWLEIWTEGARYQAWDEHRQILALVRNRDSAAACAALATHIRASKDRLLIPLQDDRRRLRARGFAVVA